MAGFRMVGVSDQVSQPNPFCHACMRKASLPLKPYSNAGQLATPSRSWLQSGEP